VRISRRHLLEAAGVVPIGLILTVLGARASQVLVDAAPSLRPTGGGTSATRCALCGASDHAMLDPRCPAARQVL
jgi:hypothetical protein